MLAKVRKACGRQFGRMGRLSTPLRTGSEGQRGFTLIEIVLVVALMLGLMAYLISNLVSTAEEKKKDEAKLGMGVIQQSLQMYRIHNNRYPTTDQGLNALVSDPGNAKSWRGPYIEPNKLNDPWGEPFSFESDGRNFKIISASSDNVLGTEDDITYPEEPKS